jgi:hypothetical protein
LVANNDNSSEDADSDSSYEDKENDFMLMAKEDYNNKSIEVMIMMKKLLLIWKEN